LSCYTSDYSDSEGVAWFTGQESLDEAMQAFETTDLDALMEVRRAAAANRYKRFLDTFYYEIRGLGKGAWPMCPPILAPADCPPISIVTLLYNRKRFFDPACHNIMISDYPHDKIEWVIVEDSDDPAESAINDVIPVAANSKTIQIVYVPLTQKMSVSAKRNLGVERAKNTIVLMMDDDDHYPDTSFRRRVAWLTLHPWAPKVVCATTIACYDLVKGISAVNVPPLGLPLGQRISEATLTFRKTWWETNRFPEAVQVGEGEGLITGREQDVLEIPPQQVIVAFSHGKNTSSRRIPSDAEIKPGCFWEFPKEYLVFIHGLAGVKIVQE